MSSGVSQISYWREVNQSSKNGNNNNNGSEGGPGAEYLSYNVFLGLSVLGGLLGLDHLYLRSPLTFLAKLVINILFLGVWWLYDATQAFFNRDVVKVYGLGIPGLGPKGIGAGCLASDVPDKKHMSFFIYGLALFLGGIFGLDSFIVGDKKSGFIRLVCLITGIFAPVAIFWWLFNLFKFFFKTKDVTNQYWEYFGAPPPADYGLTIAEQILTKIPFLQNIFGPVVKVAETTIKTVKNVAEAVTGDPTIINKIVEDRVKPVITQAVAPVLQTAIEPTLQSIRPTLNTGIATVQTGIETARQGIALGEKALETGSTLADKTLNTIGKTANVASRALTLAPSAAALTTGFTQQAAKQALNTLEQSGGMVIQNEDSGILSYVLVGTLGLIVVSGLVLTYRRFRQNEQPRKDDSPPEPGVLRESNKKESSKSA